MKKNNWYCVWISPAMKHKDNNNTYIKKIKKKIKKNKPFTEALVITTPGTSPKLSYHQKLQSTSWLLLLPN